jgi:hypothetical protein
VNATRYGPDDTWPEHQDKFWRESLSKARRAGWTLNYINAPHRFGVVSCPAGEHTFAVGKTPKGSETRSKEAEKKVIWCEHPPPGPLQDRRDQAGELLDVAEQITCEVAEGLDKAVRRLDAYKLVERLEIQLKTAAASVSDVLRAEQEAALEAAIEADDADSEPPVLEGRLDTASTSVARSESIAKPMKAGHPGIVRPLLQRARELRDRIGALRSRLEILQKLM